MNINSISKNIKCTCSKSGCSKKYCICFSNDRYCQDCDCQNCENKPKPSEQNLEKSNNINAHINQKLSCNCTKSNCMKKYCECYKKNVRCTSFCRCILCNNFNSNDNKNISNEKKDITPENENNINLPKSENLSIYRFHEQIISKISGFKNPIKFQFDAFEIYVKKEKLKIDKRKINLSINSINEINNTNDINNLVEDEKSELNQTPKFSKKKRIRSEEDNPNMKTCPTTNSLNKENSGLTNINKNIKKKKLQL